MPEDELPLKAEGLSLDAVYENFVRQLADTELEQAKIRKEKQLNRKMNRQMEMNVKNLLNKMDR